MTSQDHVPHTPPAAERRSRLRQYQMQLLERMQAAKTGAAASGRELGVTIAGQRCLLDLTQVSEIVPLQPVTPVPLAHDWYQGLTNIRGNLTGVIDLARYQGELRTAPTPDCRLITFAPGLGFNCALLVERVLGLRRLDEMTAQPEGRFIDAEGQQWTRIDLAELIREPRFLQLGV